MFNEIEKLKQDFTDKYVVVAGSVPELRRFEGHVGQVKTVNMSGRALVQFDAWNNIGWYDIDIDFLKVVPKPEAASGEAKHAARPAAAVKSAELKSADVKPAAAKPAAAAGEKKLSPLEMARCRRRQDGRRRAGRRKARAGRGSQEIDGRHFGRGTRESRSRAAAKKSRSRRPAPPSPLRRRLASRARPTFWPRHVRKRRSPSRLRLPRPSRRKWPRPLPPRLPNPSRPPLRRARAGQRLGVSEILAWCRAHDTKVTRGGSRHSRITPIARAHAVVSRGVAWICHPRHLKAGCAALAQ